MDDGGVDTGYAKVRMRIAQGSVSVGTLNIRGSTWTGTQTVDVILGVGF